MTKPELQKIALKLYNKGILNPVQVECSREMWDYKQMDQDSCVEYIDEILKIGKRAFRKKYCIKH